MQLQTIRIFFMSAVVSVVSLGIIYGFSYSCFASEAVVTPVSNEDAFIESSSFEGEASGASSPSWQVPDSYDDVLEPSSSDSSGDQPESESDADAGQQEENPDDDSSDTFGQVESEWEVIDSGFTVLDSGLSPDEVVYNPVEDLHAIRKYFEFFLFGLLPVSAAITLVVVFCVWFYRTFVLF